METQLTLIMDPSKMQQHIELGKLECKEASYGSQIRDTHKLICLTSSDFGSINGLFTLWR